MKMKRWICMVALMALLCGCAGTGEFGWLEGWDDCDFELSTPDAYRVAKNGKWGFIDGEGKVLIEPKYDSLHGWFAAEEFGFAVVDGKYGYVDAKGREIVPTEYDNACAVITAGLGWLEKDGRYALVNETGLISDFIYEDVYPYWSIPAVTLNGKWGMVNADGECPAGFIFDEIDRVDLSGKIGSKYAALDARGEMLLPPEYDEIRRIYGSDLIFFTKDGTEGWLNTADGSYVETAQHNLVGEDGAYVRCVQDGKTGFLDRNGELAAEFEGENVYGFNGEYALVYGEDMYSGGVVNRDSELVLEQKYFFGARIDSNSIVRAADEGGEPVYYHISDDAAAPISTLSAGEAELDLRYGAAVAGLVYAHELPDIDDRYRAYREGWEYVSAPAAKDAQMFVVHADHPAEDLSSEDIRRIYGGFVDDWSQLGADLGKIVAYQPDDYDYDRAMFEDFMAGAVIMEPERMYFAGSDGDAIALCYRNLPGAIGFCMYSRRRFLPDDVRILSVDGVFPTAESIRSGEYPWTTTVYTVGKGEKIKISREEIEKYGFVPLK